VIDTVLMPAREVQQVLPYQYAVGGVQQQGQPGAAGLAQPATTPGAPQPGIPAPEPVPACYPSLAAAIAGNPQLSVERTTLGLSGVSEAKVEWW